MFKEKKERIEKINKIKMGIALSKEEIMELEDGKKDEAKNEEDDYVDDGLIDEEVV